MITAAQSVYLTEDRSRAVPEGSKDARFLLVRKGHEIHPLVAEMHAGAKELLTSEAGNIETENTSTDGSYSAARIQKLDDNESLIQKHGRKKKGD